MSTDAGAVLVRQSDIVGADRDQTAISNFHLTVQLDQEFGLPAVLGTKTSAAEYQNHGMRALQFR